MENWQIKILNKEFKKIFDMFTDDGNQDTITSKSMLKVAREIGEDLTEDEIKDILNRASANGQELTFDEFYEIMTQENEEEY